MSVDWSGWSVGRLVGSVGWLVRLSVYRLVQSVSGVSRSVGLVCGLGRFVGLSGQSVGQWSVGQLVVWLFGPVGRSVLSVDRSGWSVGRLVGSVGWSDFQSAGWSSQSAGSVGWFVGSVSQSVRRSVS